MDNNIEGYLLDYRSQYIFYIIYIEISHYMFNINYLYKSQFIFDKILIIKSQILSYKNLLIIYRKIQKSDK